MKNSTLAILFLLTLASACLAVSITGQVIDPQGKPIENVNISVKGAGIGTTTDTDGLFSLEGVSGENVTLVLSHISYPALSKSVALTSDEVNLGAIVFSGYSPIISEPIVVTATRRPGLLNNVPEITMVISEEEMELISPQDVSDAVAYLPGVSVEGGTMAGHPFKKTITIDGLPSQYCMVLMNGAKVVSSHYHTGANVNVVPPEAIDHIELVKGAASAQYGSDGMGGVLNIITKEGTDSPEMLFTSYGGSQRTFHSSLLIRGAISDRIKHSVFSSWVQSDGPPIIEPERRLDQLDYTLFHLLDKVNIEISDKLSLDAQMFYQASSYPYRESSTEDGIPYDSWLITPKLDLGYNISNNLDFNVSAYYTQWNNERNSEINEIAEPEVSFGFAGLKNNYLLVGGEYIYRNFRRKSVEEHDQTAFGVFLQDEWTPFDKLSLLGAVRFDKVEDIDAVFTPKITAMYKPCDMIRLRASVGQGFRAPSIQDLYETLYGHGTHVRAGNPDLGPEYSTGITAGAEIEPLPNLSLMVNGYYTALTDMITPVDHGLESPLEYFSPDEIPGWDPDTLLYIYRRENIHKATIYGGELKLLYNFLRYCYFEGAFNYTYNKNEDTDESLPYYPGVTISGKIFGERHFAKWLDIGGFIGINAASGRKIWKFKEEGQQQVELDDYQKLDAGLNVTLNDRYEIFGTVDNMLGQEIHTYEDVEMRLEGKPLYSFGIRIEAF